MLSRSTPRLQLIVLAWAATVAIASAAFGQAAPNATGLSPDFVRRGESVEVTVNGGGFAGVNAVEVTGARGVAIEIAPPPPDDLRMKLKVTAAADAPPGERELRLIAPTGVSAPLRLTVEQYPPLAEAEPNNKREQAQGVAQVPAVLRGRIETAGDVDAYRLPVKKGQTLVVDVFAARTGSPLDPNVLLFDPAGKEVASNNDFHGFDSFLAYDVPADGTYTLEIRDLQYRGGGDYAYRAVVGPVPYLRAVEPMAGQRGKPVDVRLIGHNLREAGKLRLDLTYAQAGPIRLRAPAPGGLSNDVAFEVTDLPPQIEQGSNNEAPKATPITAPADATGVIETPGDVDFFRFKATSKQVYGIEVLARRLDSPLDALLTLHDANGNPIQRNDDAAGADARIAAPLDPGDYLVSVRDLAFAGGPSYAYRLSVRPSLPNAAEGQDFAVRFMPDAVRINRGSHVKVWCDVARINGYAGEVTVAAEDLPPGLTCPPVVMAPGASGVLTVSAAPDAMAGSFPIRLRASGTVGGRLVTRTGEPELNGRAVGQAYVTVLDAAPFTVAPVAALPAEQVNGFASEIAGLVAKLSPPPEQLAAQQAEWEKKVAAAATWTTLEPVTMTSTSGAVLTKQPDGSILVSGAVPDAAEAYTVIASTDVKGILAVRLEALTDPSLPTQGPGRAPNGNFVLHEFTVTAAPKADPAKAQPVALQNARATFAQEQFAAAGLADNNPATGWAIVPQTGKSQSVIFSTAAPVGFDGGTQFTITMPQTFGQQHTLGKFRISVATDAGAADAPALPDAVGAIVKTPADQRTPEQKQQIAEYYRSIDPTVAANRARLDVLRNVIAPYAEIGRLEAALTTQTPELDAALAQWEQQLAAGGGWTVVEFAQRTSEKGTVLSPEPDGSVFASGAAPPQDTYTLVGNTPLKGVTAVRLEALPDPRLPGNGPGRNADGNFMLTGLKATIAPAANAAAATPIEFASAKASFEQAGTTAAAVIDDKPDTGWGVAPLVGRPHVGTFLTKVPVGGDGGSVLTLVLAQQSATPNLTLGRFRVSVTNHPTPDAIPAVPQNIVAILKTPAANRTEPQKAELAAYYRSIAPALDPVRQRLAELRAAAPAFPITTGRGRGGSVAVLLNRNNFPGDVTVTLEGFQSGREGAGPAPIAKSLKVNPLTLNTGATLGVLTFTVEGAAELGTKLVVLRAEGKVGNDTAVQYSPAFPVTVFEE